MSYEAFSAYDSPGIQSKWDADELRATTHSGSTSSTSPTERSCTSWNRTEQDDDKDNDNDGGPIKHEASCRGATKEGGASG